MVCCHPALGANVAVNATTSPNAFVESAVTIAQGDTVTWTNVGGGLHNVHFDDDSFAEPSSPSTAGWTVYRAFTQPGTYPYYCEIHGGPGGFGMSGTITVNPATSGGGGTGGGGGGVPPPPVVDNAPVSSLTSPATQRLGRVFVEASMNESGTLSALATVSVPGGAAKVYRFKRASRTVSANQAVKLRLKLSKRAFKQVQRALTKHKLRVRVSLTATDVGGKQTIRKLRIRLKR